MACACAFNCINHMIPHYGVNQLDRSFKELFQCYPGAHLFDEQLEMLDAFYRTKGRCKAIYDGYFIFSSL